MKAITKPGLYPGIPNADYHRGLLSDPKPLSSSMAKALVTRSPAEFKYESEHRVEKSAFDEGQAVHELVLEGGFKSIDVYEFDSWRTGEAKAARAESYAAKRHPMLRKDIANIEAMANAVKRSALASAVFTDGRPEVSALVQDPKSGIWLQARFDWLRLPDKGQPVIADLKTTAKGANPRSFNREIAERHYHLSMAFYRHVLMLLGYDDPKLTFVAVDKAAPHLVSVHDVSISDRIVGDLLVNKAITTYAHCLATDSWPGFDTETHITDLPAWATYEAEEIAGPIYQGA